MNEILNTLNGGTEGEGTSNKRKFSTMVGIEITAVWLCIKPEPHHPCINTQAHKRGLLDENKTNATIDELLDRNSKPVGAALPSHVEYVLTVQPGHRSYAASGFVYP